VYTRRKLTLYVANDTPFSSGVLFVAYWHTDNPTKALIDPDFYEHVARGDLEFRIWIAELSALYTWDFVSGVAAYVSNIENDVTSTFCRV
jgi:hypothetical protein